MNGLKLAPLAAGCAGVLNIGARAFVPITVGTFTAGVTFVGNYMLIAEKLEDTNNSIVSIALKALMLVALAASLYIGYQTVALWGLNITPIELVRTAVTTIAFSFIFA